MGALDGEEKLNHESFAMVQVLRVSGVRNLVGVEYDTGHHMELIISEASLYREGVHDRFLSDREIVRVAISDVQWAQLITSIGTQGVPCTLTRRQVGQDMKYVRVAEPPVNHNLELAERASKDVRARAARAMDGVATALSRVSAMLKGGAVKKGELTEIKDLLSRAHMEGTANLAWVVQAADEEIVKSSDKGKAEVEAYLNFAKQRIGEAAIAQATARAIAERRDPMTVFLPAPEPDDGG